MDYPTIDMNATGRNIRMIIDRSNYSVTDVVNYLGTNRSLVYRYMRGEVLPSIDRLLALSTLLNVTINDLLVSY